MKEDIERYINIFLSKFLLSIYYFSFVKYIERLRKEQK